MPTWQQDVLHSMGLSVLQPRFEFPAALPGLLVWQEFDEVYEESISSAVAVSDANPSHYSPSASDAIHVAAQPTQVHQATQVVEAVTPAVSVKSLLDDASAAVQVNNSKADTATDAAAPLRFRLRLVCLDQLMVMIDQPSLQWAEEESAKTFLYDIYFALFGKAPNRFQQAVFNWPPVKNFPLANDREQARLTLTSFMREMQVDSTQSAMLSFGRGAEYVLGEALQIGECQVLDASRVLALHTLQYYWQEPSSKHLLWQHLQAIKKALA